jgi:hypothetical protein
MSPIIVVSLVTKVYTRRTRLPTGIFVFVIIYRSALGSTQPLIHGGITAWAWSWPLIYVSSIVCISWYLSAWHLYIVTSPLFPCGFAVVSLRGPMCAASIKQISGSQSTTCGTTWTWCPKWNNEAYPLKLQHLVLPVYTIEVWRSRTFQSRCPQVPESKVSWSVDRCRWTNCLASTFI